MTEPVAANKCENCGTEFSEPDGGGTCILCLLPYCNTHLGKKPTESDIGALCTTCAPSAGG